MSQATLGDLTNTADISAQQNRKSLPLGEKDDNVRETLRQKLDFKNSANGRFKNKKALLADFKKYRISSHIFYFLSPCLIAGLLNTFNKIFNFILIFKQFSTIFKASRLHKSNAFFICHYKIFISENNTVTLRCK